MPLPGVEAQPFSQFFRSDGHADGVEPEVQQALPVLLELLGEVVKDRGGEDNAADAVEAEGGDGLTDGGYRLAGADIGRVGIVEESAGEDLIVFEQVGNGRKISLFSFHEANRLHGHGGRVGSLSTSTSRFMAPSVMTPSSLKGVVGP